MGIEETLAARQHGSSTLAALWKTHGRIAAQRPRASSGSLQHKASITSLNTVVTLEVGVYLCESMADVAAFAATSRGTATTLHGFEVVSKSGTSSSSSCQPDGVSSNTSSAAAEIDACCRVLTFATHVSRVPLAKIGKCAEYGRTLLFAAASSGRPDVARFLLEHLRASSLIHERDDNGATALHYAALEGHDHVVNVLVEWGADVNVCDYGDIRPIQLAAESGHTSAIAALIVAKADVNVYDQDLNTPVLEAAINGHELACGLLAAAGADVLRPNLAGKSPLRVAKDSGSEELVRVLMQPLTLDAALYNRLDGGDNIEAAPRRLQDESIKRPATTDVFHTCGETTRHASNHASTSCRLCLLHRSG